MRLISVTKDGEFYCFILSALIEMKEARDGAEHRALMRHISICASRLGLSFIQIKHLTHTHTHTLELIIDIFIKLFKKDRFKHWAKK